MKSSLEIIAEIIPSVRAEVARELMTRSMNQTEVSRLLGVSQAAVSQYVRNLRGKSRRIDYPTLRKEAKLLSEKILNNKMTREDIEKEIYSICEIIKR